MQLGNLCDSIIFTSCNASANYIPMTRSRATKHYAVRCYNRNNLNIQEHTSSDMFLIAQSFGMM